MSNYSKLNIVYQLQKWMDSVAGQTFMNYAYSWGAAVVILGTLFKLTHLPGANLMLFIGMGTEVFVFFISAFDRPFDKTADGMELATDSALEKERLAALEATLNAEGVSVEGVEAPAFEGSAAPVIIGGGVIGGGAVSGVAGSNGDAEAVGVMGGENAAEGNGTVIIGGGVIGGGMPPTPAPAVSAETAEGMEEATKTYVERLNELNEILTKVSEISARLAVDSEEMENLNRTLTGISRVYEMQLKSASQQITTQDSINEQTRKMAEQIEELNACYSRMIEAMKVNMK